MRNDTSESPAAAIATDSPIETDEWRTATVMPVEAENSTVVKPSPGDIWSRAHLTVRRSWATAVYRSSTVRREMIRRKLREILEE